MCVLGPSEGSRAAEYTLSPFLREELLARPGVRSGESGRFRHAATLPFFPSALEYDWLLK